MRKWLIRYIPHPIIRLVKKWHYPRVLKQFDKESWTAVYIIEQLISPGSVIVDAGANIGYVSMLLARLTGPAGEVHSFEPIPETYSYLVNNLKSLGITNVRTYNSGLSKQKTELAVSIPTTEHGLPNFYEARISEPGNQNQNTSIRVVPLDEMPGISERPVALMKIDVEGHEWAAIQGAKQIIETHHPILFIEIDDDLDNPADNAGKLQIYLRDQGYETYIQQGRHLIPRAPGGSAVDYFFIHSSRNLPPGLISN